MSQIDEKLKVMLDDFESNYALPKELNKNQQRDADTLLVAVLERVKLLYGADIHTSHEVTPNGATLNIKSYCIYSVYDFISFIEEESGSLSLSNLLDEMVMSFKPNTNNLIKRLVDEGVDVVVDDYMPPNAHLSFLDSDIEIKHIPTPLLQAISKAYIIKDFVGECLGHDLSDDQVSMQLTITELVLCVVIKRNGKYYEIQGINDVHNVALGIAPTNDFSFINEDCMTTMYKKIGVGYIPDVD